MCDKKGINISNFRKLIDKTTREKVAKALGCDTSLVTKHYNGDRSITLDYAIKYADYFNVSLDYLVGRSNVESSDKDIQYIGDYTGLKIETINFLHRENNNSYYPYLVEFINYFLSSNFFATLQQNLYWFDFQKDELFSHAKNHLYNVNGYYKLPMNKRSLNTYLALYKRLSELFKEGSEILLLKKYIIVKKFEKMLDEYLEPYEHSKDEINDKLNYYLKKEKELNVNDLVAIQDTLKEVVKMIEKECTPNGND